MNIYRRGPFASAASSFGKCTAPSHASIISTRGPCKAMAGIPPLLVAEELRGAARELRFSRCLLHTGAINMRKATRDSNSEESVSFDSAPSQFSDCVELDGSPSPISRRGSDDPLAPATRHDADGGSNPLLHPPTSLSSTSPKSACAMEREGKKIGCPSNPSIAIAV